KPMLYVDPRGDAVLACGVGLVLLEIGAVLAATGAYGVGVGAGQAVVQANTTQTNNATNSQDGGGEPQKGNSDKNFTKGFEKCNGCGTQENPVKLKVFEVLESKPLPIDEITTAAMTLIITPEAISTIGGLILFSGVGAYIIIQQFDDPFPGPFYTERPTDYIPNEFNKNNYNSPPPNWEDFLGVVFVTGVSYYLIKDRL